MKGFSGLEGENEKSKGRQRFMLEEKVTRAKDRALWFRFSYHCATGRKWCHRFLQVSQILTMCIKGHSIIKNYACDCERGAVCACVRMFTISLDFSFSLWSWWVVAKASWTLWSPRVTSLPSPRKGDDIASWWTDSAVLPNCSSTTTPRWSVHIYLAVVVLTDQIKGKVCLLIKLIFPNV